MLPFKTRITVLNFILFVLGLTTEHTRITKLRGKKFEVLEYTFSRSTTDKLSEIALKRAAARQFVEKK